MTINITADKSHLLTLGERMYMESIELLGNQGACPERNEYESKD